MSRRYPPHPCTLRTDVPQVPTTPSSVTRWGKDNRRGPPWGLTGTHGDSCGLTALGDTTEPGVLARESGLSNRTPWTAGGQGAAGGKSTPRAAAASPPGEGRRDNKTTRAEMHRPALVPRTAVCARPGGPAAAQTPSPGGGPGLATDWGLLSEKLELGKKGLLPGPRHAHCAKTESPSRSPKPTVNQGIIIPFTREFAAFIGQASPPPAAHQTSTKEGSGTRVTLANARPCCFSVPPKEDAQPSRLLHTSQVCRLQTDPLHEPLDPKTSCGINLCTVYKADVPSGWKHNAKFHTAFQKNENSERTCC